MNTLLNREEVFLEIESASNPSFAQAEEFLEREFKVNKDCFAIKAIRGGFGSGVFRIEAHVYPSKEHRDKIEPRKKDKKVAAGGGK
ncbi:MAG: hypothetical protein AABX65_00015 [Nanoarchaeota archaeon]